MIKIVLLLTLVGVAVVSASDYEPAPYYSNYYAPIYSMNSNPRNQQQQNQNQLNNNVIRNSYYSTYGYKKNDYGYGYGKGSPYYTSKYSSCVQNNNNNNGNQNNNNNILGLLGLLNGCNGNGAGAMGNNNN